MASTNSGVSQNVNVLLKSSSKESLKNEAVGAEENKLSSVIKPSH